MKKFLVILFVGFTVLVNAQSWTSSYREGFKKVGQQWEKVESINEINTFGVLEDRLVWTSDRVVTYPIKKVDYSDEEAAYVLKARVGKDLVFFTNPSENIVTLMFESEGSHYALIFILD